jgi:hypothetical protein
MPDVASTSNQAEGLISTCQWMNHSESNAWMFQIQCPRVSPSSWRPCVHHHCPIQLRHTTVPAYLLSNHNIVTSNNKKYKSQVSRRYCDSWRQRDCIWQIHLRDKINTTCKQRVERTIGALCYHNPTQHRYDFIPLRDIIRGYRPRQVIMLLRWVCNLRMVSRDIVNGTFAYADSNWHLITSICCLRLNF